MIKELVFSLLGPFALVTFCICPNIVFKQERGLQIKISSSKLRPSDAIYGYHFGKSKGLLRKVAEQLGLKYNSREHKCYKMKLYTIKDPDSESTPAKANMRLCLFNELHFYLQKISDREFVKEEDNQERDEVDEGEEDEAGGVGGEEGRENENIVDYVIFHKERLTVKV